MDAKDKKLLRNTILIFGIVVILLGVVIVVNKVMTANAIKEQENYEAWLKNNCNCTEKERPKCSLEGFEYNKIRKLCVNTDKKYITYPSLSCSEYNCSNEIKFWNNETEVWEDKLE
jgi:hypothetical protein